MELTSKTDVIYEYGALGWLWRVMALAGIVGGVVLVRVGLMAGMWGLLAAAVPLLLPAIALPWVVASRIVSGADDTLEVTNLFFVRRVIPRDALGAPRVRQTAQGSIGHIAAPRAWIPVRGRAPIYVDLNASIPDPPVFRSLLKLPRSR